jgi:hypothetical protein
LTNINGAPVGTRKIRIHPIIGRNSRSEEIDIPNNARHRAPDPITVDRTGFISSLCSFGTTVEIVFQLSAIVGSNSLARLITSNGDR